MERSPTDIGSPLRTRASVASADDEIKALNLVRQQLSTVVLYRCLNARAHASVVLFELIFLICHCIDRMPNDKDGGLE